MEVRGNKMAPPVSADVLRKMKKTAEDYLGEEVTEAVITVPAYFNDSQRQATKDAGRIAGLEVKRIINEPTAALAFGLDKNEKGDRKIAVYDLGGGTFDVSIIEIADVDGEKQFEVLSTNGDTFLGGETSTSASSTTSSPSSRRNRALICPGRAGPAALEGSRRKGQDRAVFQPADRDQPAVHHGRRLGSEAPEPEDHARQAGSAGRELIERTIEPCRVAIKDAGVKVSDIDDVILVGGMTRMPKVQEKVKEFFGKDPRKDVNPDEAVAAGAAIQGSVLSGERKDVLLLDVTPVPGH